MNKGNRRIIAGVLVCTVELDLCEDHGFTGVCLLLAVKFYTDAKKQELRALIEVLYFFRSLLLYISVQFFFFFPRK